MSFIESKIEIQLKVRHYVEALCSAFLLAMSANKLLKQTTRDRFLATNDVNAVNFTVLTFNIERKKEYFYYYLHLYVIQNFISANAGDPFHANQSANPSKAIHYYYYYQRSTVTDTNVVYI